MDYHILLQNILNWNISEQNKKNTIEYDGLPQITTDGLPHIIIKYNKLKPPRHGAARRRMKWINTYYHGLQQITIEYNILPHTTTKYNRLPHITN